MSFDSTGTLSFGQTYGRRNAVMQDAWSVVKDRSLLSVAPYNFTGMFTRPKAIAPLHRARAMDPNLPGFGMKDRGALNDLSVALTLFKVDLRPSYANADGRGSIPFQAERERPESTSHRAVGWRPENRSSGKPKPSLPVVAYRYSAVTRMLCAAAPSKPRMSQ